jgi:hypothetical protein
VAGSFAFTTPTTVPTAGTDSESVTFTPADTTDYKTATGTSPLTVTGQTLTVTANDATKVYGTANPTFTGSVTGAVNGDTFAESFSTTATTTSDVGTYPDRPQRHGCEPQQTTPWSSMTARSTPSL